MGGDSVILSLGFWNWFILGGVLLGLELLTPGIFLLWFGVAAGLTGLFALAFGGGWQGQALVFAVLSAVCVLAGRRLHSATPVVDADVTLNRRAERHLGRIFILEAPISGGVGRVRIDDSTWRVEGPDLPVGARVVVRGVDGSALVVAGVDVADTHGNEVT